MKLGNSFGNWLRSRRKALDLTQFDLADQVDCSVNTIRKIEVDERRPSKQIAERLADVLAIALEERAEFVAFARHTATSPPAPPLHGDSAPTHNLPPQPTPFIGRADELTEIAERLAYPHCQLLTLVGWHWQDTPGARSRTYSDRKLRRWRVFRRAGAGHVIQREWQGERV